MFSALVLFVTLLSVIFVNPALGGKYSKEELKTITAGPPTKYRQYNIPTNYNATSKDNGWVYYSQCDYRWANQRLGWCDEYTLCTGGCAMTSTAMILATKGVNINPSSLDDYLSNYGGYANGCDLIWAKIDDFGVTSFQGLEYADESAICNGLSQGHGIVANVNNGEHWVLLTGCLGGGVFSVNDPAGFRSTYSMGDILMEAVYH